RFFQKNPFTLQERHYPIDFGYPRKYKYQLIMKLPNGYSVKELPESRVVNLGDKMATLRFYNKQLQKQLSIVFEFDLNTTHFSEGDYSSIKEIFKDAVDIQNNSLIVLKKD
ncbi:MAG: hypothetical protein KAJ23_16940, partial [Maribacter sp.]|nr:hypothetical protein [Maribacter sp.]